MQRKITPAMLLLLCAGMANATVTTSTFIADGTSSGGQAVDAKAVITFNNMNDMLTVVLTNLLPNPTSVAQNITDFGFQIQASEGALSCSSNCLSTATTLIGTVAVNPGGSYTVNSLNENPGWGVTHSSAGFSLNARSGTNSIIGPWGGGGYTNANSSIAGHTMINQSAEWVFLLAGLPNNLGQTVTISNLVFSFGTTAGDTLTGIDPPSPDASIGTPEPLPFDLAGTGLVGIYFLRRRSVSR
jgi:hypothetical protein